MKFSPEMLRLYLVTDTDLCSGLGLVETVRAAVQGGVTMVQLRDKTASTSKLTDIGQRLMDALNGSGVPMVVNDDLDAAIACGADGAHIGQGDCSAHEARKMIGPDKILGLSCETPHTVMQADQSPVDYLGLGPVFGTPTKKDHEKPIGFEGLAKLIELSSYPNVAIGGLKADHVDEVMHTGADGLAVVSAICGQADPEAAARKFKFQAGELRS